MQAIIRWKFGEDNVAETETVKSDIGPTLKRVAVIVAAQIGTYLVASGKISAEQLGTYQKQAAEILMVIGPLAAGVWMHLNHSLKVEAARQLQPGATDAEIEAKAATLSSWDVFFGLRRGRGQLDIKIEARLEGFELALRLAEERLKTLEGRVPPIA